MSGNEYQIEEALEEADPDYYAFDDGGEIQLSFVTPSPPVLDALISDDKDAGQEERTGSGCPDMLSLVAEQFSLRSFSFIVVGGERMVMTTRISPSRNFLYSPYV